MGRTAPLILAALLASSALAREAEIERERSAQGGWLGIGRTIQPGDKDYNRGSLNPNRR